MPSAPHSAARPAGLGAGLRTEHLVALLESGRGDLDWMEASLEYLFAPDGQLDGRRLQIMEMAREQVPLTLHSFALNLGSVDPLSRETVRHVRWLMDALEVEVLSDHLCWTAVDGRRLFDLMPLPMTPACVQHLVRRIAQVQDWLGRRIVVENVALDVDLTHHEMTEWEFLNAVAEGADCHILLDVANVYISARNLGYDPKVFLREVAHPRVRQIHLANYAVRDDLLIDVHSGAVPREIRALYAWYVDQYGAVATNVEWDNLVPTWPRLQREVRSLRAMLERRA